jgi:DAK2 domain fusion protein YloV
MSERTNGIEARIKERLAERYRTIDGPALRHMVTASLDWLRTNQQVVNSLNVFPVPDGDTGTNMVLTMQSAVDEVEQLGDRPVGEVAHAIAHGALMGARGNSGVILSQLWRGFSRSLDDRQVMDAAALVEALQEARETAYKGVVRPVEGTILTVSKDIAIGARNAYKDGTTSTFEILEAVVQAADESVERTPELLPILKEAGVVDSGGKGLFFLLEGILRAAYRQPLDQPLISVQPLSALALEDSLDGIEPGQDWEVVVDFQPTDDLNLKSFYGKLESIGTSIQIGEGDGMYRMHIHVADAREYEPIDYIRSLGSISKVAIENLMLQIAERNSRHAIDDIRLGTVVPDQIAVVAVAPGMGIARIFASLGVAGIIEGGQTMNPSTQEILASFEDLPTDKIVLLPNNKNIILAAKQAAELTVKHVAVLPCVSVPQGIAAMFAWEPDGEFEATVKAMTAALGEIHFVEVTTATRSVEIDGVNVTEGQSIGLLDGKLACSGDDLEQVLWSALDQGDAAECELITLYYGADLTSAAAHQMADLIRDRYTQQEVEVLEGGQPHYQLILSLE